MEFVNLKKLTMLLVAPLLLAMTPLESTCSAPGKAAKLNINNDEQLWLLENFKTYLTPCKDIWATVEFEHRWGDDFHLFWYQGYELRLYKDLTKCAQGWLDWKDCCGENILKSVNVGIGILEAQNIAKQQVGGCFLWTWVHKPTIELNFVLGWRDWKITNRIKDYYNHFGRTGYESFNEFRYRIEIYTPWKFTCWNINPYISNEFFLRPNSFHTTHPTGIVGGLYEDRLRAGIYLEPIKDKVAAQIYGQWRPLRQKPGTHPRYFNTYAAGFALFVTF